MANFAANIYNWICLGGIVSQIGEKIGEWFILLLKTIALWLDWIVYETLTYVYMLFAVMCRLNFSTLQALLSTIVVRIQILFGVVMLFIVAFNLLTYLVDPSKVEQKGSNLAMKIIVSVGMLVVGNFWIA